MDSFTVTELNDVIKNTIHVTFKNKFITVSGEISNVKISGKHTYLTLKDDNTSMSVVFWNNNLKNDHGDHVEITGKVEYYAKSGNVNLIGTDIKNIGVGSQHTQYEKIRAEYEKKGYFNNRVDLPKSVKNIGIVTSKNGAALKDFLYVLDKSGFSGEVYIYDCIVQGNRCPASVASGIKFFNSPFYSKVDDNDTEHSSHIETKETKDVKQAKDVKANDELSDNISDDSFDPFATDSNKKKTCNDTTSDDESDNNNKKKVNKKKETYNNADVEIEVDLIVITRGGGSFEDLMGFSDPKVIEAIYTSNKYTISAVGHEIDNMLSDYVANYRAPTPSIAGEIVCMINNTNKGVLEQIDKKLMNIKHNMLQTLIKYKNNLKKIKSSIRDPSQELDDKLHNMYDRASDHIKRRLLLLSKRLEAIKKIIDTQDVNQILENGMIVLTDKNGNLVSNIDDIFDKNINLIHASGSYEVMIKKIN